MDESISFTVSLPSDEDGYIDRQCPSELCHAEFKVFTEDWKERVTDEKVYCPICRFEAPANEWNTDDQMEYFKQLAVAHFQKVIHQHLADFAQKFNQKQRSGFVTISMSIGPTPQPYIVPVEAAEIMQQRFECEICGCRYASIGAAFFCPACGHNSVISMFNQTIEAVRQVATMSSSIRNTLASEFGHDIAQNSVRQMLEDSLGRLVSSFQQFSEVSFQKLPTALSIRYRKNVFQNLKESSGLWKTASGKDYGDFLLLSELEVLEMLFQMRHLIAHRNGIVDQEYIDKSEDKSYSIGQRIVVSDRDVLCLADLISRLADGLKKVV